MKPKRMLVCGQRTTSYDETMLGKMSMAFMQEGIDVIMLPVLLPNHLLNSFCAYNKIDTIFEINRSRNQLPILPEDINHVAWIQDVVDESRLELDQSVFVYFLTAPSILGYENIQFNEQYRSLYTGVDEQECHKKSEAVSDFSIVGYIPAPLSKPILASPMMKGRRWPTIGKTIERFLARYRPSNKKIVYGDMHYLRVQRLVMEVIVKDFGISEQEPYAFEDIIQVFYGNVVRAMDRAQVLDTLLELSSSIRIFGGSEWAMWPKYAPDYLGYLETPAQVYEAYRTTRVNIHNNPNGFGLHSRVFDCMGCSQMILVNESPYDTKPGGIQTEFEPWVDYVPYTIENLGELAAELLHDRARRELIGANAQKKILAAHTWRHRAAQVLADLKKL